MATPSLEILPKAPASEYLELEIENAYFVSWYDGNYEVTPSRQEQILPTENKTMREDVVVHPIPYREETNEYGTTYIIGG